MTSSGRDVITLVATAGGAVRRCSARTTGTATGRWVGAGSRPPPPRPRTSWPGAAGAAAATAAGATGGWRGRGRPGSAGRSMETEVPTRAGTSSRRADAVGGARVTTCPPSGPESSTAARGADCYDAAVVAAAAAVVVVVAAVVVVVVVVVVVAAAAAAAAAVAAAAAWASACRHHGATRRPGRGRGRGRGTCPSGRPPRSGWGSEARPPHSSHSATAS